MDILSIFDTCYSNNTKFDCLLEIRTLCQHLFSYNLVLDMLDILPIVYKVFDDESVVGPRLFVHLLTILLFMIIFLKDNENGIYTYMSV